MDLWTPYFHGVNWIHSQVVKIAIENRFFYFLFLYCRYAEVVRCSMINVACVTLDVLRSLLITQLSIVCSQ